MNQLTTVELSQQELAGYLSQEQLSLEGPMLEPLYYRQFGLRRAVQLVAPTLRPIAQLELPRQAIIHHLPMDETLYGIDQDDPLLAKERRMVAVDHVLKLTGDKGPPRPRPVPIMGLVRDYHRRNRRTRRVFNIETILRDPVSPLVINYGLLPHVYYYTKTYLASYNKWYNLQVTQLDTIVQRLQDTKRTQYLPCYLPTHLPSLQQLNRGSRGINRSVLNLFNEPSALFILELWKWLGEDRETSLLSRFPEGQLDRINFIWIESGHWFVMNLGLLDSWRKSERYPKASIAPMQMQRRFLRLLMYLFETRSVHTDDVPIATPEAPSQTTEPATPAGDMETPKADTVRTQPVRIKVETPEGSRTLRLQTGMNVDLLPEDEQVEETAANIELIDEAITRDLETLDQMYERRTQAAQAAQTQVEDEQAPVEIVERDKPSASDDVDEIRYTPQERTLESGIMDQANLYADQGLLSAAEYRRMTALSAAYRKLPDPYKQSESLAAAAQINVEDLKIRKDIQVPDSSTIFDKSMLSSTLSDFTSRYVEELLPKDIVRSVLAIQHAGVAVTGYTVEEVEDAMGHYENHAVQLTPVRGKPSTVHFRLPKVDPDGTYTSNGVRQRMRLQRIDIPIRKLSPSRVALTSYYAKTFVNRSQKKVHDYTGWLTNQIAARGLDPEDQSITDIMLADVFDSYQVVPRIYSALAQRFRAFRAGEYEFFLDYHTRHQHFGQEWVETAEREGWTVIGRHRKKPIVVDRADALYVIDGESIQELGRIETLIGLQGKAPIEVTEVKILNKQLPLGIILAYLLGLDGLIEITNATPRRVPTGERLFLADHEFAVRFEDEALVFSRDNRIATMLFAGFNVYEQSIRNYASHLFNRKDIYQNVLDQNRIGPRYLREAELMRDLFVDPITRTILEQMREPTDLVGLLLRSCELLMTDWSPAETDMRYMRIRGYERLAGTVYSELVRSIRGQRSRGSVANSKIEMAPYAVWQAITQDSANKQVEESNPIHNLKEKEEVTFSGSGGRSARSMVKRTRVFHENDMGVISEATKDSGDVAITTFLTMDPNLVDLYGRIKPFDPKENGPASMVSTSALVSPAADRDD